MAEKKYRADELLVAQGLCLDTKEAAVLIMSGKVRTGPDHVVKKTSEMYPESTELIVEKPYPYVSRGAEKLLPALDKYLPDLSGMTALDVGASTGGFTDLMLQRGAVKVHAVDAGRGQLHLKLRNDPRVVCHEQTNARKLPPNFLPEPAEVVTMDVSFISVTAILPAIDPLLKPDGWAFLLVKPQFEAPREQVEKGGVVRDKSVIAECVNKVADFCREKLNWQAIDRIPSPIHGPKGNREVMTVFRKPDKKQKALIE